MPRPVSVLALLGVLFAAASAAPAAAEAAGWQPGQVIATNGGAFARPPILLLDDAGRATAVYRSGGVQVVTRGSDGSWGAPEALGGAGSDDTMDAAIAPATGRLLIGRSSGTTVTASVRDPGGAWQSQTFTAALAPTRVAVGLTADGRGVIAWDEGSPSGIVRLALLEAGGWSAAETFTGADAFFRGRVGRDDDGAVILAYERPADGVVFIGRRSPGGGAGPLVPVSPTVSRLEGFSLEPTARRVVLGFFHNAPGGETDTYRVWQAGTDTLAGGTVSSHPAVRPAVQSGSHAAFVSTEPGIGDGFATWMDSSPPSFNNVAAATGFGSEYQTLDLVVDRTRASSVAGARSGTGESFTVYTEVNPNFPVPQGWRIVALRRAPCSSGGWAGTEDVLSFGKNYGAVSAGASATGEVLASAVTTSSEVVIFRYVPAERTSCAAPPPAPVNFEAPGLQASSPPIVCGGSGSIVPQCFGQIPQPRPLIVCGAAFGTMLQTCDGLGLGIGGAPIGLGGEVAVEVACGAASRPRQFGGIARITRSLQRACPVNLELDLRATSLADDLLRGLGAAERERLLRTVTRVLDTYEDADAALSETVGEAQQAAGALTTTEVPAPVSASIEETMRTIQQLERSEGQIVASLFEVGSRQEAAVRNAVRGGGGLAGSIRRSVGGLNGVFLEQGGLRFPELQQSLQQLTTVSAQLTSSLRALGAQHRQAIRELRSAPRGADAGAVAVMAATSRARRLARRLPGAGAGVVVADGTRARVRLRLARWTRPLVRRAAGKRLRVTMRARATRAGQVRTARRSVTLRVRSRR